MARSAAGHSSIPTASTCICRCVRVRVRVFSRVCVCVRERWCVCTQEGQQRDDRQADSRQTTDRHMLTERDGEWINRFTEIDITCYA